MWLFHKHNLVLVGKTYVEPDRRTMKGGDISVLERLASGSTTFVWKCSDPNCSKIVKTVAMGKETG